MSVTPQPTVQEIARFLRALYRDGDVFEVRVPKCRARAGSTTVTTHSGFYTFAAIDQAAADIAALDERAAAPGFYVTLNPVSPALLARANGKIQSGAKETTKDKEIVRRCRILIDLDPIRPAKVSSTDAELAAARALAAVVVAALRAEGWPDPFEGMSGNGGHLIYGVDLPADDGGLIEQVLAALAARFNTDTVKIDTAVGNASRITKVLGTMARKGENLVGVAGVEDRPHRRSAILSIPETITPVSRELLESVAAWRAAQPKPAEAPANGQRADPAASAGSHTFERFPPTPAGVRGYLEKHGIKVVRERAKGGGTILDLDRCPVVPDCPSEGTEISVLVGADGRIAYKNHHDRGQGLRWVDVREALEPGYKAWVAKAKQKNPQSRPVRPDCPGCYEETPLGIVWNKSVGEGTVPVYLTNFTARIVAEVTRDDGAERRRVFAIEGTIGGGGIFEFDVPAERFAGMGWPVEFMGVGAIVSPGQSIKDHTRAAIQHLSKGAQRRVVYLHLGWCVIDGKPVYLHAGGAIGTGGMVEGVEVSPPGDLANYILPAPPDADALKEAVRASLDLINFKPERLAVSLLTAMYRAPLGSCAFSLHVAGSTGALKSSTTAAILSHFGTFDDKSLPGSWMSTDNSTEALAFAAKDVPFVIDDFAPAGTANDVQRLHAKAERVMRGAGNQQGRGRLMSDTSFRTTKYPRGLVISTGEDIPNGQSIRARTWIVEVRRGEVTSKELAKIQRLAAAGVYARAMSGYLQWLAGRIEAERKAIKGRVQQLRDGAIDATAHLRTPVIAAELRVGLEVFCRFAVECGAITQAEAGAHVAHAVGVLAKTAGAQATYQRDSDPVNRFLSLLGSALASGDAHIASAAAKIHLPEDEVPANPDAWGWRSHAAGSRGHEWRPCGARVGWTDGTNLYLDPDAAHRAANKAAGDQPLGVGSKTLSKRMSERGLLVRRGGDGHITVKMELHGARPRVLHLRADVLGESGQSGQPGPDPPPDAGNGDSAPIPCPDSDPPAHETGAENRGETPAGGVETPIPAASAPFAPIAPVLEGHPPRGAATSRIEPPEPMYGPPNACYACGRLKWWSTSGLQHWTCGGCRDAPDLNGSVIHWHGNEEGRP